jgi:biotin-(acetyl-CoA carboxylase) ligase
MVDTPVPAAVASLLGGVASAYRRWAEGGFAVLHRAYESRLALLGDKVCVRSLDGAVRAEGVVQGVDERGRLLVEADDAVVAVAAGEVTLRA